MRILLSFLVCACVPAISWAQDKKDKKPGDEMIEKYLAAETDKLSAKFLDGAKTLDEWKARRPRLHREYLDMLGIDMDDPARKDAVSLRATQTGEIEAHGVVVKNIHFQSKPGLYVTANLYLPKNYKFVKPKSLPAILYVCGHSSKGRDGNKTAFQDHGFWFANHGYVCIILDTLQLGEIPGVHHGTYGRPWGHLTSWGAKDAEKLKNHNRFWWHSIGYSPAAVECWNGIRAIDYLCTVPMVDPDKIGVTGISGGGAATFWIAAADDRVKVAVPVSGMADLEFYVKQKGVNGHCDCMFLYNTYQWDWTTIAALVAPRPMLFANSDKDAIFPMDANRRIYKKLQTIYGMYGVEKAVGEYVSVGGHDYRPDLRKAIFHFFNLHLKRQPTPLVEDSAKYTPLEGKKLRVFPTDADLPKDSINHRVDEVFIPAAKVTLPEKGKFAEWKKEMIHRVREKAFHYFPAKYPEIARGQTAFPHGGSWFAEKHIEFWRQEFPGSNEKDETPTIAILSDKNEEKGLMQARKAFGANGILLISRGQYREWTEKSPPNYVERCHLLLGRTYEEGRVFDIVSTIKMEFIWAKEQKAPLPQLRLVGVGKSSILAAYAALFEPSIKEVVVIDPPKSHKEGPHFLNVLRVLDIPEALGLLAPTPLTIVGGLDPAFDRTAEIYKLAGAADKLKRK